MSNELLELKITAKDRDKFIVLKKDYIVYKAVRDAILQLLLPKGTVICVPRDYNRGESIYPTFRKLRANQAFVLAALPMTKTRDLSMNYVWHRVAQSIVHPNFVFRSKWSIRFTYKVGKLVKPHNGFNKLSTRACSSGIHFFVNPADAEAWL